MDATQDSSSALEGAMASSPEVNQEIDQEIQSSGTETSQQTVTEQVKEPPFHEHPRWKEMMEEKRQLQAMLQREQELRHMSLQQMQGQPADPYAGMSAEEKAFYQNIDRRIEERARQISQEQLKQFQPVIEDGRRELVRMKVEQFFKEHPDVKPGSMEETAIAQKIKQGYPVDDAYAVVMYPLKQKEWTTKAQVTQQQKIQQKRAANVETSSGIPAQQQPKPKSSFADAFLRNLGE